MLRQSKILRKLTGSMAAVILATSFALPLYPAYGPLPSEQDVLFRAQAEDVLRVYQQERLAMLPPPALLPTRAMADRRGATEQPDAAPLNSGGPEPLDL